MSLLNLEKCSLEKLPPVCSITQADYVPCHSFNIDFVSGLDMTIDFEQYNWIYF